MPADTNYIHALRFSVLNALYDPIVATTSREQRFKLALLDGVNLQAGQRVLDIGCGTGTLACMLAQRQPRTEIHGLDGDLEILERARRKASERGAAVEFTHGMSFELPFPDQHFDNVLSSLFFHHLTPESKRRTLAEIQRVLKPGGGLHIADWGAAQDPLMRAAFLAIQLFDGFGTTQENIQGRLPSMMQNAGFENVHVNGRFRTVLGTMEIVRAQKRTAHDPGDEAPNGTFAPPGAQSSAAGVSWQGALFNKVLQLLPGKKLYGSAATLQEAVRKSLANPPAWEPRKLGRNTRLTQRKSTLGWPMCNVVSTSTSDVREHVVFLHGGGYFQELAPAHWRFIEELVASAPVRCIVPVFPLAPQITAQDIVPAIGELLRQLADEIGAEKISVIANSSGAGLGLAATQWLRDSKLPLPGSLVLISPWLDVSVSRREQAELAKVDPLLDVPGLVEAGRLHAGALDVRHPFVSPLYGDLRGLPPMTVFAGTLDLLYPDSVDLARKAAAAGSLVDLRLREGLPHNYAFMPTPEGREARAMIACLFAAGRPAVTLTAP